MKRRDAIRLTDAERDAFLDLPLACTLATIGKTGFPQLTAMWFVMLDGKFHFATYAKSQKVLNLQRDPRCSVLVEDGKAYNELRGYSVEGNGVIVEDTELAAEVLSGCSRRYVGIDPVAAGQAVLANIRARAAKRVVVRVDPVKEISWDHRKLGGTY